MNSKENERKETILILGSKYLDFITKEGSKICGTKIFYALLESNENNTILFWKSDDSTSLFIKEDKDIHNLISKKISLNNNLPFKTTGNFVIESLSRPPKLISIDIK